MDTLIRQAQENNETFDGGMAYGENPQKLMVTCVKKIYEKAYMLSSSLGYMQAQDQLVAAQVMTDVIMKNLSPVALEIDKYAEFANGYVLNHPNKFYEVTGMDGTEFAFTEAKKSYEDIMNREEVKISELQPNENKKVVAPVEEVPSINVPIFNK